MNLIKTELKKTTTEMLEYYPDYIVNFITEIILFLLVCNTSGNVSEKATAYVIWILINGVLSEASLCISTEKQLGTLQNLMIKPYSILRIMTVKTIVWFSISFIKTIFFYISLRLVLNKKIYVSIEELLVIIVICLGVLGVAYILSVLTLIYTKVASFVNVIGYLFLFLSGCIYKVPKYIKFTNPLSSGMDVVFRMMKNQSYGIEFCCLLFISLTWFGVGVILFKYIFKRSKQFKWSY